MAGMENVVTAVSEDDALAFLFPAGAGGEESVARIEWVHLTFIVRRGRNCEARSAHLMFQGCDGACV